MPEVDLQNNPANTKLDDWQVTNPDKGPAGLTQDNPLQQPWVLGPDQDSSTANPDELALKIDQEMTAQDIGVGVVRIAELIKTGNLITGEQLRLIRDLVEKKREELATMSEMDAGLSDSLLAMENEWLKRQEAVKNIAISLDSENEKLVMPDNPTILDVKNEGDVVTTTVAAEDGSKTEIKLKEQNIWSLLVTMSISDAILGTNQIHAFTQEWIYNNALAPFLKKLGIDPNLLKEQFASRNYEAFNGFMSTANSRQMEKIFADSLMRRTTSKILEQMDPLHLQKMFDPTGTKSFGKVGGLFSGTYDHLQLSQDLVDELYNNLSESERRRLRIPTKAV
ncbi:MAG: hypothetical protein COY80_03590 [Candidatus Pacebacteria bacterium CG_4_10_14_0_8_um_filter_42_14]|nr:MAG: hypothetical protein COY80_03590 [Candidatus Pacebacteria bacterium CG_4_10_14_0_8_um_filter_42_14]